MTLSVQNFLSGAVDELKRHGVNPDNIDIVKVPGAFEIPVIAQRCVKSNKYSAIITLGAVIKGSTPHFDYVSAEVSKGVAQVSLQTGVPVIFGVLTTDNIEQAIERAGTKAGNKGSDAAKLQLKWQIWLNYCNTENQLTDFRKGVCYGRSDYRVQKRKHQRY